MLRNKLKIITAGIALAILLCPLNASFAQKNDSQIDKKAQAGSLLPSKYENKNVLGRFFVTMMWVFGSCGVIYVLLLAYKRRKEAGGTIPEENQDMALNLNSPMSENEAIEFVIKKF